MTEHDHGCPYTRATGADLERHQRISLPCSHCRTPLQTAGRSLVSVLGSPTEPFMLRKGTIQRLNRVPKQISRSAYKWPIYDVEELG